ncbi:MAG: hypothetical protein NT104_03295 [Bacteroidetes bacterium]|jgi:hypothetical protein|nr:hypothetical protein [Bacteroidota bacterium]
MDYTKKGGFFIYPLLFLVFSFSLISQNILAQDAGEIQVYGSATTPKYTTIIELHSNYTFKGPKSNEKYHPLLETIEITSGLSKDFELGFYIFTYNNNGKLQYTGSHIRPRVKAPDSWNWPLGVSLSTEIGFDKDPFTNEKDWGAEIRPIFDKTIGDHYWSFNPSLGVSFTNNEVLFEPNLKYAYASSKKASIGFEYFGNTGKLLSPYKLPNQEHQLYAVVDLYLHPLYEFNFGIGKGLTESANGLNVKCFVGRRINWKHK